MSRNPSLYSGYKGPHRGVMILVPGILSLVVCAPLGIPAWVMGQNDLEAMDAGDVDPEGGALTTAGMVCGIVGTLLFAVQVLFLVGVALLSL